MKEAILQMISAMIAVAMTGGDLFWVVEHPDKEVPPVLANSLTMIIGYHFGRGSAKVD